jgi:hypothetical protein
MKHWRFMAYISEAGTNLILKWYESLDEDAQADFDITLNILAGTQDWRGLKQFKILSGKYVNLGEIRFVTNKVQYRPVGYFGPNTRQFTLLIGCSKKGRVYKPPDAFDTALKRLSLFRQGRGSIHEHSI